MIFRLPDWLRGGPTESDQVAAAEHLNRADTIRYMNWFRREFAASIPRRVTPPFHAQVLCAIACKETGGYLCDWFRRPDFNLPTHDILARCVFDRGPEDETVKEQSGKARRAYPYNTKRFRADFGPAFTDMLIEEGRQTRLIRKKKPDRVDWIYMGYGIFQFDIQYAQPTSDFADTEFFRQKRWGSFDACLDKVMIVLEAKYKSYPTLWDAVEAYNGRGRTPYRKAVQEMYGWILEEWPLESA